MQLHEKPNRLLSVNQSPIADLRLTGVICVLYISFGCVHFQLEVRRTCRRATYLL